MQELFRLASDDEGMLLRINQLINSGEGRLIVSEFENIVTGVANDGLIIFKLSQCLEDILLALRARELSKQMIKTSGNHDGLSEQVRNYQS